MLDSAPPHFPDAIHSRFAMHSASTNISLPPYAAMDPSFKRHDLRFTRSPSHTVAQPRLDATRTQTPFSSPDARNTYTGPNPAYFSYHPASYPDLPHLIAPASHEKAYQFDRQVNSSFRAPEPFNSHFCGRIPPLVRPTSRELPRVRTGSDRTAPENSGTTSPVVHRVISRPLVAKNRPLPDTERVFKPTPEFRSGAWTHPRSLERYPFDMEDGQEKAVAGRKRKSSYDEGEADAKPQIDELSSASIGSKYRADEGHARDEAIIPGVALNLHAGSGFPHYNAAHGRPSIASRPSGSNISLSSSPGKAMTPSGTSGMASNNRTPSVTPRSFPVGVSNGTINPNARGLGGDGQETVADGNEDGTHTEAPENTQEKAKRKKPRVALSCAQCTKVSYNVPSAFAVLTVVQRKQKCNREIPCQHCTGKSRWIARLHDLIPRSSTKGEADDLCLNKTNQLVSVVDSRTMRKSPALKPSMY